MYEKYADDIFRYIYVHVNDRQTAEDLTADTFMRAWKKLDSFDFKHARGWLYKIAHNLVIDFWRKKKPLNLDEAFEAEDDKPTLQDEVDKNLEHNRLHSSLKKLPKDMRSVVAMRFLLGYSVRKTAKSLELSEANVRVMQFRALKKMKEALR